MFDWDINNKGNERHISEVLYWLRVKYYYLRITGNLLAVYCKCWNLIGFETCFSLTLETSDFTFCIGSTPTFLYFDLYVNTAFARNVRIYFLYRQYTNLFIFRFVYEHCLRSTLRLFHFIIQMRVFYQKITSDIFSISSLVKISMASFTAFCIEFIQ